MIAPELFHDLLARVQAGDADAADELVRGYEAEIRLEVRVRLRVQDGRLRRTLDTMDITQSVLASFFAGVAAGRYSPEDPRQLLALLTAMTRNKLLTQVRHQRRQRRDVKRIQSFDAEVHEPPSAGESPSQLVADRELLSEFRKRLTVDERRLAERRKDGQPWETIASELGGTPEGRRKQLARAFARVAEELGIETE